LSTANPNASDIQDIERRLLRALEAALTVQTLQVSLKISLCWTQWLLTGSGAIAGALIREIVGDLYRVAKRNWTSWKSDGLLLTGFGLMIYLTESSNPVIPEKLGGLAWFGFLAVFLLSLALISYFRFRSTMSRPPRN
jgi:hypothetical protein